jgi:hypothetical protein
VLGLAIGGATTVPPGVAYVEANGAWLDQINNCSPEGSMRGPCQLAQPDTIAHIATASDAYPNRVVDLADISDGCARLSRPRTEF